MAGDSRIPAPEVLYWRTTTDLEVDFVLQTGNRLLPIEVKATGTPGVHWNGAPSPVQALERSRDNETCLRASPIRYLQYAGAERQTGNDLMLNATA